MKKALFILLLAICSHSLVAAQQPDVDPASDNSYFEQAYTEIAAMLDGKAPLSIKRAVFLQEWAYLDGKPAYNDYCHEIDSMATAIKQFIKINNLDHSPIGGNIALFEFFTHSNPLNGYRPFDYDFEDFRGDNDYTKLFVTKLIRTHKGQCRSLPLLYKILANQIGAAAFITYAPNHSFIRHRDEQDTHWMNLELTNGTFPREVFIIETMGITQQAIDQGTYLKPCTDREVIVGLLTDLANTYLTKFGFIDPFVQKCLGMVFRHAPLNLGALITANNCIYAIACQHRAILQEKGIADDEFMQSLKEQLIDINDKIAQTGHIDMPKHLYDAWVQSVQQEIQRRKQEK